MKNFANKYPIFWALLMAVISFVIVFSWGIVQIKTQKDTKTFTDEPQVAVEVIKFVFYFVLLFFFFKVFSLVKPRRFICLSLNVLFFFVVLFVVYMLVEDNLQYLSEKLNPLSVKQWNEDGYLPAEEGISETFFWLICSGLSFVNILLLNLLSSKLSFRKNVIAK